MGSLLSPLQGFAYFRSFSQGFAALRPGLYYRRAVGAAPTLRWILFKCPLGLRGQLLPQNLDRTPHLNGIAAQRQRRGNSTAQGGAQRSPGSTVGMRSSPAGAE